MRRMLGILVAIFALSASAAYAREAAGDDARLKAEAEKSIEAMTKTDPDLQPLLSQAAGYIVFPKVSEGGLVVGGGGARGVWFEQGRPMGFAELSRVSVGAQAGAQRYAELVVVRDAETLSKMKQGKFDIGGGASATALQAGASKKAQFTDNGVAVLVQGERGAMVNISVAAQRIKLLNEGGAQQGGRQ
jgi:lipid-binding SYLF domain-containing protein